MFIVQSGRLQFELLTYLPSHNICPPSPLNKVSVGYDFASLLVKLGVKEVRKQSISPASSNGWGLSNRSRMD